jgi:predicted transcriptional regulator
MEKTYDREKIIGYLFEPRISSILSELESGSKDSTYLSNTLGIFEDDIRNQLSYLIEHGFVIESRDNSNSIFSVNKGKLAEIMEHDENYESAVDGLTKLDGFLN